MGRLLAFPGVILSEEQCRVSEDPESTASSEPEQFCGAPTTLRLGATVIYDYVPRDGAHIFYFSTGQIFFYDVKYARPWQLHENFEVMCEREYIAPLMEQMHPAFRNEVREEGRLMVLCWETQVKPLLRLNESK